MKTKTAQRPLSRLRLLILLIAALLIGSGLWYWRHSQPRRVHRSHAQTVAEEFKYLTHRFDFNSPWDSRHSKIRAEEDLDELEWLLENRYSYLHLKGVDYKAALDSIRCSLGDGIQRNVLGYQLSKFMALFGDGHSRVASSSVRLQSLCSGFPPFLVEESMDGSLTKCIQLPFIKEKPIYGFWPRPEVEFTSWEDIRPESRIFTSNIAYLRFVMMSAEPVLTDFIGQSDTVLEKAIRAIEQKNNSLQL